MHEVTRTKVLRWLREARRDGIKIVHTIERLRIESFSASNSYTVTNADNPNGVHVQRVTVDEAVAAINEHLAQCAARHAEIAGQYS